MVEWSGCSTSSQNCERRDGESSLVRKWIQRDDDDDDAVITSFASVDATHHFPLFRLFVCRNRRTPMETREDFEEE